MDSAPRRRQVDPSFAPGHRVSPRWLPTKARPWNAHFLGGSCLQTLVDRALKPVASLLPGRGCTGLCAVRLRLCGETARPSDPMPGAMPSHPNGQTTWGCQRRAHEPTALPSPAMQAATCPGWVVCVDSWWGGMQPVPCVPSRPPSC